MLGNQICFCLSSAVFFKIEVFKNSFRNTIRVSNGLDPDQDRHSVGPDLRPNCLLRKSAGDKMLCGKELKDFFYVLPLTNKKITL